MQLCTLVEDGKVSDQLKRDLTEHSKSFEILEKCYGNRISPSQVVI